MPEKILEKSLRGHLITHREQPIIPISVYIRRSNAPFPERDHAVSLTNSPSGSADAPTRRIPSVTRRDRIPASSIETFKQTQSSFYGLDERDRKQDPATLLLRVQRRSREREIGPGTLPRHAQVVVTSNEIGVVAGRHLLAGT